MSFKKNIEKSIDKYLIHKSLHDNIEEMGRARFIVLIMLFSSIFVLIYTAALEFSGKEFTVIKTVCNYLGASLGVFSVLTMKYSGNIKLAIALNLLLGTAFVIVSAYYSGGIFSVDSFWFVLLAMISFMFVGKKWGLIVVVLEIAVLSSFYVASKLSYRDFWQDNQNSGVEYEYLNLIFLLLFASLLIHFFVSGSNKIKAELDALKNIEVKDIGNKYKYITDNATDIIALHNKKGISTYISPAINTILGFAPNEVIGLKYSRIIEFNSLSENNSKIISSKNKAGIPVWLEIKYTALEDELGEGHAMISIARDVTNKILEDKKLESLREQIANDFHDEMGNKLAAITLNTNVLSLKMKDNKDQFALLEKIEETSKSLYQNSRDFIWSIDPKSDRLDEIFFHLKDFAEDFTDLLPIEFESQNPEIHTMEKTKLPMYWGRHIILIFKEGITNAVKHSNCSLITLKIIVTTKKINIQLIDNGEGFNEIQVKAGRGINSMKKRAKSIACSLLIESTNSTILTFSGELPKMGSHAHRK